MNIVKRIALGCALLTLAPRAVHAAGGIDLTYNACPATGGHTRIVSCFSGLTEKIVGTIVMPAAMSDLELVEAQVTFDFGSNPVPQFWDFEVVNSGALTSSHVRASNCGSYTNTWSSGGISFNTPSTGLNSVTVQVACAIPSPVAVIADQKIFGFSLSYDVSQSSEAGGPFTGCFDPVVAYVDWVRVSGNGGGTQVFNGPSATTGFGDYVAFNGASPPFTLSTSAGAGGAVFVAAYPVDVQAAVHSYHVAQGGSRTITISPDPGYYIAKVLVDGNSVGAVSSYTFSNVTANHTITGTFGRFVDVTSGPLAAAGDGRGVAWGDYDNDGDLDLYVTNLSGVANKLFRNDAAIFVDATGGPLGDTGDGQGAAWGDYDNDGDLDLYLVNNGQANKLFRNDGGSFADVTTGPLGDVLDGRNAAWGDYDNDGDLDLYLANVFALANKLFRNDAGTFVDATSGALISGGSFAVVWGDYDGDGDLDVYNVRNGANQLLRNDGAGTFADVTSGPLGNAGAGHGAAWGDYDNDGDLDLYLSNNSTPNELLRNDGGGAFADVTTGPLGDAGDGDGVAWGDYDNDGDLDLYLSNNSTPNKLFRNEGGGTFAAVTSGPLGYTGASFGTAWGDYDNDGDLDLYVANSGASNKLLRNDVASGNHWLQVKLQGVRSNRSGIGARVRVVVGGVSRIQEVSGGSGYLSQNSLGAEFGLGATVTIDSLIVRWPSGIVQVVSPVPAVDQIVPVVEKGQLFVDATSGPLGDTGFGYGVAWGDFDNDGDLDLHIANSGQSKLFRNDAGTWVDATAGALAVGGSARGATWGDFDNDGDLDLYLTINGSANRLLRNDAGTWVNATSGPLGDTGSAYSAAWADYDRDGDLDLYLANNGANKMFRNDNGTWGDATSGPLGDGSNGRGVEWADYDNDGDLDLYVTNTGGGGGSANKLFRNEGGGVFVDATSSPLGDAGDNPGAAWGDYDNDGDLDLYLASLNVGGNKLFRNEGGGAFVTAASPALNFTGATINAVWGDYDNDGDLDLYVANINQANKLFRNDGGGTFVDATSGPLGVTGPSHGVAWGDYDNDGDLDLYLMKQGQANKLFRNDGVSGNHWLQVRLQGTLSNRSAIGARVMVVAGGVRRIDEVVGGTGYVSQNSMTADFGLGAATTIDSLIVRWPSGNVWDTTGVAVDQRLTLIERLQSPLLTGVGPDRGGNAGPVTLVVTGWGIQGGATVKLTRSGQMDIAGTATSVTSDGRSITATFDLLNKVLGAWNVVVTNPDLRSGTLTNAFTIELADPPQLRVDLIGSWAMRPDRRRGFDIVIQNLGNTDLFSVPLWISNLPVAATFEPDFVIAPPPQSGGEPSWSAAPPTFGSAGGRYLPLVIPRVPPGTTTRRFYLTVPNTVTNFTLDAAIAPPWSGQALGNCLVSGGVITAPLCVGTQLASIDAYLAATPGIEALSGIGLWAKIAWQCEGANANLSAALVKSEQVLDFMQQPIVHAGVPAGCEGSLVPRWQDTLRVQVVNSLDPNDKLGADGLGATRQIGSQQLLPYVIRFENKDSTGVVPAQVIVVTDVLDASKLDLSTVSLGPIKFGRRANGHPWTVDPGSGQTRYTQDVDLRPEQNLKVRVSANLDAATGVLSWSLTAIDPATGQVPEDPLVGFLPRNATPPEGEGSLLFTVTPKPSVAGGAQISNRASINFDGRTLLTPYWSNAIDNTPPESQVLPLGGNQDSVRFTVRWAPVGTQPDLRDYSVYVSDDSLSYRPWRLQTTATADTLNGLPGRRYWFYSLARDSSGNLEAVPLVPDGGTRVAPQALAVGSGEAALALEGAVPNPATGPARVWFTLPSREHAVLELLDVTGRRVFKRDVGAMGLGRHSVDVSAAARRPGIYFLRLTQGDHELRARMAVIR